MARPVLLNSINVLTSYLYRSLDLMDDPKGFAEALISRRVQGYFASLNQVNEE